MFREWKGKPQIGRKYLHNILSDKGFVCEIHQKTLKIQHSENKQTNLKMSRDLNIYFSQENVQMETI